jgi:zinc finger protein
MTQQSQFFPTIGKVVEDTSKDSTEAEAVVTGADDTDDAPVQEIESLCMSCHEQVSLL